MNRATKSSEYIRHTFTSEERLKMGDELAQAFNRMEDIETEESVLKAQIKERKTQVEQSISKYSRELANGFTMMTVECRLEYDVPNPNEVSYVRIDNGQVVKTRPFTESERQADLPLEEATVETLPVEESAANAEAFFGQGAEAKPEPGDVVAAPAPKPVPEPDKRLADPKSAKDVAAAKKKLELM
jgi:hypothetical protein